jgi:homoserine/homoserine lactone efflux protein
MSWGIWALFAVTETALCFTPAPAVLLVLSQGLARGTASSIWSNLGILVGNTMYFVLSGTSLGAALLASYEVFSVIRWVGAAYLVWLDITAFVGKSAVFSVSRAHDGPARRGRIFINGFVLQAYGALAGRLAELARRPRFARLAKRIAGSMLVGAGIGMARLRRA